MQGTMQGAVGEAAPHARTRRAHRNAPEREALVAAAQRFRGGITREVYDAVARLLAEGHLPVAAMPSRPQFWRYCRGRHPDSPSPDDRAATPDGDTGRPRRSDIVPSSAPARAPAPDAPTSRPAMPPAHASLAALDAEIWRVGLDLQRAGLLDAARQRTLRLLRRATGRVLKGAPIARDAEVLARDLRAFLAQCRRDLDALPPATPDPASAEPGPDPTVHAAPDIGADDIWAADLIDDGPSVGPVYEDPREAVPAGDAWGEAKALAALRAPTPGTRLGPEQHGKAEAQAALRARLLAPVLAGACTPEQMAARVRDAFAGRGAPEIVAILDQIPPDARHRFRNLSARSLERWRATAQAAEAARRERGDTTPVPLVHVLQHRNAALRTPRVRREHVVAFVCHLATAPETLDWNAGQIATAARAQFGWTISTRSVHRILNEQLSDLERIRARGGSEALDLVFRHALYREAPYANRAWLIDHSYVRQDVLGVAEAAAGCRDFDWEMRLRLDDDHDVVIVERVYVTAIRDAYSRRTLALRVWTDAPGNQETLITLRDAMERFGVPEVVYSDNGADFRSHAVRTVLEALGVRQVFTRPYTPQGRSKLERWFRTLKSRLCPLLHGYRGGRHPHQAAMEDLTTVRAFERLLWELVQHDEAVVPHGETRETPRCRFEESIGVRRASGLHAEADKGALLGLLPGGEVVVHRDGVRFRGRRYWTEEAATILRGRKLLVRFDPSDPDVIFLAQRAPRGALEFVGTAEVYGPGHQPPGVLAQRALEEAVRDRARRQHAADAAARRAHLDRAGAEQDAAGLVHEALGAAASPVLPSGTIPPSRRLPPPTPVPSRAASDARGAAVPPAVALPTPPDSDAEPARSTPDRHRQAGAERGAERATSRWATSTGGNRKARPARARPSDGSPAPEGGASHAHGRTRVARQAADVFEDLSLC